MKTPYEIAAPIVDELVKIDPDDPKKLLIAGPTDKVDPGFPDAMSVAICEGAAALPLQGNMVKRIIYQAMVTVIKTALEESASV